MTSLREYLESLPEDQILRIQQPLQLDYNPTALVLELEKRQQYPAVWVEDPQGFDMPVVMNLFADRQRIAWMVERIVHLSSMSIGWMRKNTPFPQSS